jgi:hypothetical protein
MLYDIMLDDVTSTYAVSRWSDVFTRKQPRIGSVVRCEFPQGTKSANTLGGFPSFCGNKLPEAHSKLDIFKKPKKNMFCAERVLARFGSWDLPFRNLGSVGLALQDSAEGAGRPPYCHLRWTASWTPMVQSGPNNRKKRGS